MLLVVLPGYMASGGPQSTGRKLERVAAHNILNDAVLAALLTALVYVAFRVISVSPDRISAQLPRTTAIVVTLTLAAMLLPAGLRLALLPWRPVPQPLINDEYSHLLVADTLISGRLANPPHPLWQHIDTIYILQHPAYASIYPLGQGMILAAGRILAGNPWFGIVLATSLMCGAIGWVLLELLPVTWAAVGVLPIGFTYGLQWIDSYWGGSLCAFGGAILCGALLRLRRAPSAGMAMVAALGWSVVWLVRPFESVLLFLLLVLSFSVLMNRAGSERKRWAMPIAMVVLIGSCVGVLTLIHNYEVTGSFTTFPYGLSQKVDGVPQGIVLQKAIPPPKFRFPEMQEVYFWQLQRRQLSAARRVYATVGRIWEFFVTPWFLLPLLATLLAIRDRSVLVAWGLLACAGAASLLYPFFFPHYIAAYACVFAFLIVRGMMELYSFSLRGKHVGRWVVIFIVLGGLLNEPLAITSQAIGRGVSPEVNSREFISQQLKAMGGTHVVFVRYGVNHHFDNEWVYNAADIDRARIVWCRWMGPEKDLEVTRYYPGRQAWIVDVDGSRIATSFSRYQLKL